MCQYILAIFIRLGTQTFFKIAECGHTESGVSVITYLQIISYWEYWLTFKDVISVGDVDVETSNPFRGIFDVKLVTSGGPIREQYCKTNFAGIQP